MFRINDIPVDVFFKYFNNENASANTRYTKKYSDLLAKHYSETITDSSNAKTYLYTYDGTSASDSDIKAYGISLTGVSRSSISYSGEGITDAGSPVYQSSANLLGLIDCRYSMFPYVVVKAYTDTDGSHVIVYPNAYVEETDMDGSAKFYNLGSKAGITAAEFSDLGSYVSTNSIEYIALSLETIPMGSQYRVTSQQMTGRQAYASTGSITSPVSYYVYKNPIMLTSTYQVVADSSSYTTEYGYTDSYTQSTVYYSDNNLPLSSLGKYRKFIRSTIGLNSSGVAELAKATTHPENEIILIEYTSGIYDIVGKIRYTDTVSFAKLASAPTDEVTVKFQPIHRYSETVTSGEYTTGTDGYAFPLIFSTKTPTMSLLQTDDSSTLAMLRKNKTITISNSGLSSSDLLSAGCIIPSDNPYEPYILTTDVTASDYDGKTLSYETLEKYIQDNVSTLGNVSTEYDDRVDVTYYRDACNQNVYYTRTSTYSCADTTNKKVISFNPTTTSADIRSIMSAMSSASKEYIVAASLNMGKGDRLASAQKVKEKSALTLTAIQNAHDEPLSTTDYSNPAFPYKVYIYADGMDKSLKAVSDALKTASGNEGTNYVDSDGISENGFIPAEDISINTVISANSVVSDSDYRIADSSERQLSEDALKTITDAVDSSDPYSRLLDYDKYETTARQYSVLRKEKLRSEIAASSNSVATVYNDTKKVESASMKAAESQESILRERLVNFYSGYFMSAGSSDSVGGSLRRGRYIEDYSKRFVDKLNGSEYTLEKDSPSDRTDSGFIFAFSGDHDTDASILKKMLAKKGLKING